MVFAIAEPDADLIRLNVDGPPAITEPSLRRRPTAQRSAA